MKKNFVKLGIIGVAFTSMVFVGSLKASAHGYVSSPISRVKNSEANGFGWEAGLDSSQPSIISTPQGIEAPTKLLDSGKINGKLSSGGRPDYSKLDEQTETRWVKTAINSGENDFTWTITAEHKTNRFRYYMTKQGWNPNTPLSLDNMELIGVVGQPIGNDLPSGLGFPVGKQESHKITIPSDRKGYHVIYSVWDINDTVNSFYQSIDVIVK